MVPVILLISAVLLIVSGISFTFMLSRWRIPLFFILVMGLILLFFSNGEVIYTIGPLSISREGFSSMLLLLSRFLCILTLVIILFTTTPFLTIIKVMRSLGLPEILADMTLFTYRYLFEMAAELRRMRISMRLRGFKGKSLKDLLAYSCLVGSMFVRSYEQAERVYQAMRIRGYGEKPMFAGNFNRGKKDGILSAVFIFLAILIGTAQIYLSIPGV